MTQQIGGYPPYPPSGAPDAQPTGQVATDEAQDVGRTAVDAGRQVAGTAAEQAGNVAQEVKTQARDLVGEARGQVRNQARSGQQKAADGIRALGQELREMADTGQSGTVSEVARQAADRADRAAAWLGEREPADLVEEIRSFARRRPGAFLVGAAIAGVVVGRLTRGAVDSARADSASTAALPPQAGYAPLAAPPAYGDPTGTALPPAATGPGVPFDAPTPPRGYPSPRPYADEPAGYPAGPGAADPLYDEPTFHDPAAPAGRPGTVGEYVDDLDPATGPRHGIAPDERFDDPYLPEGDRR